MQIEFRTATPADKDALLQLLSDRQEESNALHGETGNPVFSKGQSMFEAMIVDENINLLVGELEDKIVATLTIYLLPRIRLGNYTAFIQDMLVIKEHRQKGVGSKLLDYAIEICRQDNRIAEIKLGSRKEKMGILRFYERAGFKYKEKLLQMYLKD